jgi:hypothetical protein
MSAKQSNLVPIRYFVGGNTFIMPTPIDQLIKKALDGSASQQAGQRPPMHI